MYAYFNQLFDILNTRDHHVAIMAVYVSLFAAAVLLRIVACMAYRSALLLFRQTAKDIASKDEIKKIKYAPLRKIAAEYIRIADKSVSRIPTSALVDRQVSSMSLVGWRYVSVMPFVEALDIGLVFVGLILTLSFGEYAFMYGALAAAGFVLVRLFAAFFDFRAARDQYADEMLIYVEREIGRYFAADAGGAVLRLKDELANAIVTQSAVLKDAVDRIGSRMAEAVAERLTGLNNHLAELIAGWEKALSEAGRLQGQANASAEKMQVSSNNLQSASDLLARHLQGHSSAMTEQLSALVSAVESVKESNGKALSVNESLLSQSKYIERNQQALEASLQSYESVLQGLTRSVGDGLGAYFKLNAQNAAQSMNDTLAGNVERIAASNREVLQGMEALFEQLRGQSRDISANLLSLHERIQP
jgi:hypothetical protein